MPSKASHITVPQLDLSDQTWIRVRDGNVTAWALYQRHYSKYKYKDGRRPRRFVGPGERIVLITTDGKAAFVWRKFIDDSGEEGVNCAFFRNEGARLSSELISEAEKIARERWPKDRFYTYVNSSKIQSRNPGYCFKCAGWKCCGITKGGLIILEKTPNHAI